MYFKGANFTRYLSKTLMPLAYSLAAVTVWVIALIWFVLQGQITLAGFLNAESVWSKAQKQAVIDLGNYAVQGDPASLASFRHNYDVLDSLRRCRVAIASGKFDQGIIEDVFRRDGIMPAATPGIVFMLHYFSGAPYLRQSLAIWRSADRTIAALNGVANELQRANANGAMSLQERQRQHQYISTLNAIIDPLAKAFSVEVVEGGVWMVNLLFWGVLTAFLLAVLLWIRISLRIWESIRGSDERYRLVFDSAADAIVMIDETTGRILDVNHAASVWTGRAAADLIGDHFDRLFIQQAQRHEGSARISALLNVDGSKRPVEKQSSLVNWGDVMVRQTIIRDISDRVSMENERRIAAEALGSIVEGVIIADSQRRVVSTNAAHAGITGFATSDLVGRSFEETRRMPDGQALPLSIWTNIAAGQNWLGEVISTRKDGSTYPEQLSISAIREGGHQVLYYGDRQVLYYVAVFTNIFTSKTNQHRLEHLARHDALTGLANRDEFERICGDAIVVAEREQMAVAVLFIDLDGFKIVNDSYSHAIGDRLLIKVAERVRQQLGEHDIAGRIGGDEFTVLVHSVGMREDVRPMLNRLLASLSKTFMVDEYEIALSASIGVACYPLDGVDPTALIANADAAMYVAKTEERNAFRFYTPLMHADTRRRLQLAAELRQALARDEFHLVFQPSVDLRTGQIDAVEALVRWKHPLRGEVMPGEFIPVAESLGVIRSIDEWVLQAACAQVQTWDRAGLPRIRVAVNISARWFGQQAFVEGLSEMLQAHQIPAGRLLLEITESAMLRLGEETIRTMRELHTLGIEVAIDDFGTGYSSMAYLKLPAVAYLKIDRSFITGLPGNLGDAGIVEAMIAMSKSLGLTTIAEGVETEAQHDFLLRAGCMEGQGYRYSRPLDPAQIERLLSPSAA